MRPLRFTLATLPVVAVLAACTTGAPSAAPTSGGSGTSPSAVRSVAGVVDAVSSSSPTKSASTSHQPTEDEALATVRAYMRREVGMRRPVTRSFRRTGAGTGEVSVQPYVPGSYADVPVTLVSVQRLRTVWYVTGVRTEGLRILTPATGRVVDARLPVSVQVREAGVVNVTVTQDRYGKDRVLGTDAIVEGRRTGRQHGVVDVDTRGSAGTTGSVLVTEDADQASGGGVWRASVVRVRVRFGAGAAATASCDPTAILPLLRTWFDAPDMELYVATVRVLACRNGYAHVVAVPRVNREGRSRYDAITLYLQDRHGAWRSLDHGSDIGCRDRDLERACRALGEKK